MKDLFDFIRDLFDGIIYVGYGQWTYPKNKPFAPFFIGCMLLIGTPLMVRFKLKQHTI
jgi:hypothetical protein